MHTHEIRPVGNISNDKLFKTGNQSRSSGKIIKRVREKYYSCSFSFLSKFSLRNFQINISGADA